jgi:single-stranded DNA-binding protein
MGKDTAQAEVLVNVILFDLQAERAVQYLQQGRHVFIEGRLAYEEREQNGQKCSRHFVIAQRIQYLERVSPTTWPTTEAPEKEA